MRKTNPNKRLVQLVHELKKLIDKELQHAVRLREIELELLQLVGYVEFKRIEMTLGLGRYGHERANEWTAKMYQP